MTKTKNTVPKKPSSPRPTSPLPYHAHLKRLRQLFRDPDGFDHKEAVYHARNMIEAWDRVQKGARK